jgi:hypothetical protein
MISRSRHPALTLFRKSTVSEMTQPSTSSSIPIIRQLPLPSSESGASALRNTVLWHRAGESIIVPPDGARIILNSTSFTTSAFIPASTRCHVAVSRERVPRRAWQARPSTRFLGSNRSQVTLVPRMPSPPMLRELIDATSLAAYAHRSYGPKVEHSGDQPDLVRIDASMPVA